MGKTVLQIKNLSKRVGKKTIVQNINFDVYEGEVFGLLGPNGAGKTTIIRSIVSLISRSSGTVLINGMDVSIDFKKTIAEVGAIIENPEFYMYMSGLENLKQFARMSRKDISNETIQEIVDKVKLTNAINQKVKTYSLGMRQRLGLAQALIHKPSILILDEPTNGLDPQGMAEFRDIIREVSSQGTAVLISSHLLGEIQQITDRFAIIEKGQLTHIETMSDVMEDSHGKYVLKVSDVKKAIELLGSKEFIAIELDDNYLEVAINEPQIPEIIRLLIESVDIYSIVAKTGSLEDRFLELTEGGAL
ncbi:multidrug ABC transporter ATP-binding protein [Enterococcus sp. JM4C]|uniref:ABC transporter ATP-binding protein n=1 Tax=Candidatus Enterococcus huntleyi TaxID=1857217 RepID=UPI001379AA19|nr:ABC transporter ATP-binding protein [Enterococcus sp. JM4C]KAF1296741.1 multidrug ABC transporter ATP-binding protein [Enterococcus sp. JM4C]